MKERLKAKKKKKKWSKELKKLDLLSIDDELSTVLDMYGGLKRQKSRGGRGMCECVFSVIVRSTRSSKVNERGGEGSTECSISV